VTTPFSERATSAHFMLGVRKIVAMFVVRPSSTTTATTSIMRLRTIPNRKPHTGKMLA
jgi:hypothetical protein